MSEIFKVNDKVFHLGIGWGTVTKVRYGESLEYPITVDFGNKEYLYEFTEDGRYLVDSPFPSLSFTEYSLEKGGFSQVRPEPDWNLYKGKWGKFWSDPNIVILSKLKRANKTGTHRFINKNDSIYINFEPLSDEAIKLLNLK